jgi:hypothetical protein
MTPDDMKPDAVLPGAVLPGAVLIGAVLIGAVLVGAVLPVSAVRRLPAPACAAVVSTVIAVVDVSSIPITRARAAR